MLKQLLRSLFSTFIISIIVSTAAVSIFYAISQKTNDYAHVVSLIISGIFFLNCIILIMSLPILFLSGAELWGRLPFRIILYFSGSVAFIITAVFIKQPQQDKIVYLLTGLIFLITHSIFYYKLVKKHA